jgi:hypothetical protein
VTWPWITLIALGAWHGLNPGMGWLFAVSRGLQERSGRAVLGALPPIALGHALAIAAALVLVAIGRASVPLGALRWVTAAVLIGFGASRLIRHRHPRWVGMRVGFRDLTLWSFLMATAHGAGLMLMPALLQLCLSSSPAPEITAGGSLGMTLAAVGVHTGAMLATAGLIAVVVYEWVGLAILRTAWLNVDLIWTAALATTGILLL